MKTTIIPRANLFFFIFVLGTMMTMPLGRHAAAAQPTAKFDSQSGLVVLTSGRLELRIENKRRDQSWQPAR